MRKPRICILRTDGSNCDEELYFAFEKAGGISQMVHINQFRNKEKVFSDFQIIALPGGFSYGDDVASGKILAVELMSFFKENMESFIHNGGFIFGVCNGFQTLVRTGLLPFNTPGKMAVTLTDNVSGHFECRWVKIRAEKSKASYFDTLGTIEVPVNHGEGKFFADKKTLDILEHDGLVVFRYVDKNNQPTMEYPDNPNGALMAVAGITDKTGRIVGIMPHPEKFVEETQHPNWRREAFSSTNKRIKKPHGLDFYERIVNFVKSS